ncbi:MAG: hypothetical protein V4596_06085 [Bdellovibrionota bacterium]
MEELKWCEIGPLKTPRLEVLSQYLNSKGIQNQFTFIEATDANLKEKIAEATAQKLSIRFHPKNIDQVSLNIKNNLRELENLKAVDSLMFDEKKGYWPEILFRDSLFEFLTHTVKNLDVMDKGFVIGTCGLARASIAALIKLGFSKINITSKDDESALNLIKDFKEIFYNVQFEYTKRVDVTILPGTHGLVINTFSVLDSEDFPNEIYYFNFLKKGGLVIDLVDVPPETPFLRIAQDIGARVVRGYEAFGFYDLNWVLKVTGLKTDFDEYKQLLKTNLDQVAYDKNKIQTILDEFQM